MNTTERWFRGEISMAKLLELEGVPYEQGSALLGKLWHALNDRARALENALKHKENSAQLLANLAEKGDRERVVEADSHDEAIRHRALVEARSLLRVWILSALENTQAAN